MLNSNTIQLGNKYIMLQSIADISTSKTCIEVLLVSGKILAFNQTRNFTDAELPNFAKIGNRFINLSVAEYVSIEGDTVLVSFPSFDVCAVITDAEKRKLIGGENIAPANIAPATKKQSTKNKKSVAPTKAPVQIAPKAENGIYWAATTKGEVVTGNPATQTYRKLKVFQSWIEANNYINQLHKETGDCLLFVYKQD